MSIAEMNGSHLNPATPLLPLGQMDDASLVAAAKNGQDTAFEILVLRYRSMMIAVARRFTHAREDAEDIAQQTFQKAFVHLHQFAGHSSFHTWLTQIAINESLMWRRKKYHSVEVPLENPTEEEPSQSLDVPDPGLSPEQSCLRGELERALSAGLDALPCAMRRAIELHKLEELSLEETSRVMGLSLPAVKSRVLRGRRSLRKALQRYLASAWQGSKDAQPARRDVNQTPCAQLACDACD